MNPTPEEMIAWISQSADFGEVLMIECVDGIFAVIQQVENETHYGKTLEEAIAAAMKESAK